MKVPEFQIHERHTAPTEHCAQQQQQQKNWVKRIRKKFDAGFFFTLFACMATWLILSGKFDQFHLILGVISSFLVALLSGDLLLSGSQPARFPGTAWRFLKFLPWLLYQVFIANLHVMRLVFHPRMNELISPRIIRFKCKLHGDMARFVLANAITLTPGTITVFASMMGSFTVHVIDAKSEAGVPGQMERRISEIYGE